VSPLFEEIVIFAVMTILVSLFTWIYLRDRQQKLGLWMLGWIAVLTHFAAGLAQDLGMVSQNLGDFLSLSMLEVAGISFLLSVSQVYSTARKRLLFTAICGLPAVLFVALAIWAPQHTRIFLVLLSIAALKPAADAYLQYGPKTRYLYVFYLLLVPYTAWALRRVFLNDLDSGITFFLSIFFLFTGVLYFRHYKKRCTPGVLTASVSFVLWGLVFPVGQILHSYNMGPAGNSVFWDLPKYLVAFGMILTLFENQTAIATGVATRYQVLFEGNFAAVYVCTLDGRLLDCNSAFLKMYGFRSREEALADDIACLYSKPEDKHQFLDQLKSEGQVINYEYQRRKKDGSPLWVLERATIFNEDMLKDLHIGYTGRNGEAASLLSGDAKQCFFGIQLDITERRELEEKFLQAQKMDALGRLAGGVAHDFNNLLAIIRGFAELSEVRPCDDPHHKRYSKKIVETTERASALVAQLLTFSRKEVTRSVPLRPDRSIRELVSMLSLLTGEFIEMKVNLKSVGTIQIDPTQFEQIIINVVVNARDAMPNGGELLIATEDIVQPSSSGSSSQKCVAIRIADTGVGMDEFTRHHAFDPFFSTKPAGQGTGLGLSTVYGIVHQCGGEITIDSEPGKGTSITVLLPAVDSLEPAEHRQAEVQPMNGSGHILLVEDEVELREASAEFLSLIGYSVTCAGSGPEAFQFVQRTGRVDLVITDIVMPKMNGREFIDRLLEICPNTKFLFISGYADDVVLHAGISKVGVPFLQKPFSLTQLGCKVNELLSNNVTGIAV
jgi:PAS domain S-box-containing protein